MQAHTSYNLLCSERVFIVKKNCKYEKDLGSAHPALCSTVL
jgi:hypothetical protein